MTALDDLAPYPKQVTDVTAEGLARHLTVSCYATGSDYSDLWRQVVEAQGTPDELELKKAYLARHALGSAEYGVAFLLRQLGEVAPDKADGIAWELWARWDEGDIGERAYDALIGYGIDPLAVEEVLDAGEAGTAGAAK